MADGQAPRVLITYGEGRGLCRAKTRSWPLSWVSVPD